MSTAQETVQINIRAEISELRKQLAEVPGVGKKEAQRLVNELSYQYKRAARESKKLGDAMKKEVGGSLSDISSRLSALGGPAGQLGAQLGGVQSSLASLSAGAGPAGVAVAGAALAVTGLGVAAVTATSQTAALVDQMGTLAQTSGLTIEEVNALRLAAASSGKDLARILPPDLPKRMAEVARGTGEARVAFEALGVEVTNQDGTLRATGAVYRDLIDALARVENETERAALGQVALGESAKELMGAFGDSKELDAFIARQRELGTTITPEAARQSAEYARATAELSEAMKGATMAMAEMFGDSVINAIRVATEAMVVAVDVTSSLATAIDAMSGGPLRRYVVEMLGGAGATSQLEESQKKASESTQQLAGHLGIIAQISANNVQQVRSEADVRRELQKEYDAEVKARQDAAKATADAYAEAQREIDALVAGLEQVNSELTGVLSEAAERQNALIGSQVVAERLAAVERVRIIREAADEAYEYATQLDDELAQRRSEAAALAAEALLTSAVDSMETIANMRLADIQEQAEADKAYAQRQRERLRNERELLDERLRLGRITKQQHATEMANLDAQEEATRAMRKREREETAAATLRAWRARKAAQISQAIIDAGQAAMALTGALAYMGPAAPVVAGGIAASQLALSLAQMRKEKPPKFAMGGMGRDRMDPTHHAALIEPDEGVLTPRGVAAAGGPQGVAALNRGQGNGGQSVAVYLDSELLGMAAMRVIGGPDMQRSIDRTTGYVPGQRRR